MGLIDFNIALGKLESETISVICISSLFHSLIELNKKLSDENFGLLLKLYEKKENENTQLRQQLEELRRQSESEK